LGPAPDLFDRAVLIVESEPDLTGQPFQEDNPLSSFRFSGFEVDPRPAALALAARLASTPTEKARAKALCHAMLPGDTQGARHVMRAFLELPDSQDLTVLTSQQTAELRALATDVWVQTGGIDLSVGLRLAKDADYRVRVRLADALASAVARGPLPHAGVQVVKLLQEDVRYSVRSRVAHLVTA